MTNNSTYWIFGDSFAASSSPSSWCNLLGNPIANHAINGASEYRISKTWNLHNNLISSNDVVIFCHTNPHRIFVPDSVDYPARKLSTHPHCDLVLGDALNSSKEWINAASTYIKYFHDDEYSIDIWAMLVDNITIDIEDIGCKSIHTSGFKIDAVDNFYEIAKNNPGNINHMSIAGNKLVADYINGLI